MTYDPVLFFHCVDEDNLNAQSNNTKAILSRWSAQDLPAVTFYFHKPDRNVADNPNVHLIRLPSNRLWKMRAFMAGLSNYSAIFYPGFAPRLDDRVRRMRRILNLPGTTISTLEGLSADRSKQREEECRLSMLAGHKVFCQSVDSADMKALHLTRANSSTIIAISPFLKRVADHLWPDCHTVHIPLGVDLHIFNSALREEAVNNSTIRVVCAGNFHVSKRPELFLTLARRNPTVEFIWFGDGPMRAALLERIEAERVTNLSLPGAVSPSRLAKAFRSADIFALPSIAEGVPKVTQEAAASGLPIITMNYFEPYTVVHGLNGFQAHDDSDFFDHVERLISDSVLRAQMGAESARMALEWNWDHLVNRWQEQIRTSALAPIEKRTSEHRF